MAKKVVKKEVPKAKTIRFLKSPTGAFNLGYNPKDEVPASNFSKEQLSILIEAGYAEEI